MSCRVALIVGSVVAALGCPLTCAADDAAAPAATPPPPWQVSFKGQPTLRIGRILRIDVHLKVQGRHEVYDEASADANGFGWGQRRVGLEGKLFGRIDFEVERAIDDKREPWRDVYADVRWHRFAQTRVGRFKVPFGREELTGVTSLDFVRRSQASEQLSPARDTGLDVHGALRGKVVRYDVGVFLHDGDNARDRVRVAAGTTAAARVVVEPFARRRSRRWWHDVEFGVGATRGAVDEGPNSIRVETASGFDALVPLYVAGQRTRVGADAAWRHGALGLTAEVMQHTDERRGQSLRNADLAPMRANGWYVSATWLVTGEAKRDHVNPARPVRRGGIGAVEIGARLEGLDVRSGPRSEPAFRNPRAARVLPNDYRAVTSGINWWPMRAVRVQANVVVESLDDPVRSPTGDARWFASRLLQLQLAF